VVAQHSEWRVRDACLISNLLRAGAPASLLCAHVCWLPSFAALLVPPRPPQPLRHTIPPIHTPGIRMGFVLHSTKWSAMFSVRRNALLLDLDGCGAVQVDGRICVWVLRLLLQVQGAYDWLHADCLLFWLYEHCVLRGIPRPRYGGSYTCMLALISINQVRSFFLCVAWRETCTLIALRPIAGAVGFFSSLSFVRYIYRSIKCD